MSRTPTPPPPPKLKRKNAPKNNKLKKITENIAASNRNEGKNHNIRISFQLNTPDFFTITIITPDIITTTSFR